MVTREDYRGKGYASECLEFAREIAEKENCYKTMLLAGSKKPETLQFYEKCGDVPESPEAVAESYIAMMDDQMGFLTSYVAEHPEVDINTIVPNEENTKMVREVI